MDSVIDGEIKCPNCESATSFSVVSEEVSHTKLEKIGYCRKCNKVLRVTFKAVVDKIEIL